MYALSYYFALKPANTTHWVNAVLMLGQRRRRWSNISTALTQCIVFAGNVVSRHRDPQLQVGGNYLYWFNLRPNICTSLCLHTHLIAITVGLIEITHIGLI